MKKILFLSLLFLFSMNVSFGGFDDLDPDNTNLNLQVVNYTKNKLLINWEQNLDINHYLDFNYNYKQDDFFETEDKFYNNYIEKGNCIYNYSLSEDFSYFIVNFRAMKNISIPLEYRESLCGYDEKTKTLFSCSFARIRTKNDHSSKKKNIFLFSLNSYWGKNNSLEFYQEISINKKEYKIIFYIQTKKEEDACSIKSKYENIYDLYLEKFQDNTWKFFSRFISSYVKNSEKLIFKDFEIIEKNLNENYKKRSKEGFKELLEKENYKKEYDDIISNLKKAKEKNRKYLGDQAEREFYFLEYLIFSSSADQSFNDNFLNYLEVLERSIGFLPLVTLPSQLEK